MAIEVKEQSISPERGPDKGAEPRVEQPVSPEKKETETQVVGPEKIEQVARPVKKTPTKAQPKVRPDFVKEKSETFKQIEDILSEGLEQSYQELSDDLKKEFKEKGEETASKIEILISQAKIIVHKIVDLIKVWLSIIPGMNKFFLEQETKIKTERILGLKEKKEK
ncbi:hypothetical protein KKG58_03765 [Patescibacteria group bacterium]|nr:hypothetical protein [Patescibacteria group bacterium]